MANPWLAIPLDDYEGHMRSEAVQQLDALAELFGVALRECRPESVAVLGVAGGNGLERIDCAVTRRIVGLDINPEYLEAVRRRFAVLPGLELHCVDLGAQVVDVVPVQLVHAALIFEHAGTGRCLEHAVRMVGEGGRMSVVLQLQGREEDVAPTPYASIQALREGFRLVEPEWLCGNLRERGLRMEREERRELRGGKGFWMGVFGRR